MSRGRMADEVVEACRDFPLFADLPDEALSELARMALCHDHPDNNFVLYQDDPADELYLVLEGQVKLRLNDGKGRVVVLNTAGPGDLVGVAAVLSESPQPANAVTASTCRLAKFKAESFRRWIRKRSAVRDALLPYLAGELRYAQRTIGVHALLSVKERLLFTLMEIAERDGRKGENDESVVVERPTHRELARHIGSSREVVTRMLDELVEEGLLEGKGKVIEVPETALVRRRGPGP